MNVKIWREGGDTAWSCGAQASPPMYVPLLIKSATYLPDFGSSLPSVFGGQLQISPGECRSF